jgi:hypothetical protein
MFMIRSKKSAPNRKIKKLRNLMILKQDLGLKWKKVVHQGEYVNSEINSLITSNHYIIKTSKGVKLLTINDLKS